MQFLRTGLGDNVRVELSTVVRRIKWGDAAGGGGGGERRVVVEAVGAEEAVPLERNLYEARQVIVTVPVGILQAKEGPGAILFEPLLPAEKQEAIGLLRMGAVVKVILRFKEAFWEKRIPKLDFIHSTELAFPTWWTSLPIHSTVLTGWAGGPAADAALAAASTDAILRIAIGCLAKMFKMKGRMIEAALASDGAHVCDWKTEPLSRGAYSYAGVGGAGAAKALAKPVERLLYFAGEATHSGMSGTVAGAIASGRRAGREALSGL